MSAIFGTIVAALKFCVWTRQTNKSIGLYGNNIRIEINICGNEWVYCRYTLNESEIELFHSPHSCCDWQTGGQWLISSVQFVYKSVDISMRILLIEAKMYRCNFQMAVSARQTNSTNERFSVECHCAKMLKRQIEKNVDYKWKRSNLIACKSFCHHSER